MGAEVIKVEAPGRGDPGRASELHTVLGQAKRGIVLDLKRPEAVAVARALAAKSDVLVENFATGVMDRLGLGAEALRAINPHLIFVSASGLGRTGPESHAVAYGTLLQCYAGFAGLNRHPGRAAARRFRVAGPDVRADAGLRDRGVAMAAGAHRNGGARRFLDDRGDAVDDGGAAAGDATEQRRRSRSATCSDCYAPHGVYRCAGDDAWISLAAVDDAAWRALCGIVPGLAAMGGLEVRERMQRRAADRCDAGRMVVRTIRARQRQGIGARRDCRGGIGDITRPRRKRASADARLLGSARRRRVARVALARELRPSIRSRARAGSGYRPIAARGSGNVR